MCFGAPQNVKTRFHKFKWDNYTQDEKFQWEECNRTNHCGEYSNFQVQLLSQLAESCVIINTRKRYSTFSYGGTEVCYLIHKKVFGVVW